MPVPVDAPKRRFTPAEYLAIEENASSKSEFFRGEMFATAGGSGPHSLIATNLTVALGSRLRGGACRTYNSDLRVHIPVVGLYTYPDVTVVCGASQFADEASHNLVNPHLIGEVCSPSTQNYDRGDKFILFQSSPSLQDYLLVQQDRAFVEHFHRSEGVQDNQWLYRSAGHPANSVDGLQATLRLPSLGVEIPLAEIYAGVELAPYLPVPTGPKPEGDIPPHPSLTLRQ